MARNEDLNTKFDKLTSGSKLKRLVNKYIEKGNLILKTINEIRPDGELDSDMAKSFTDAELVEVNALLDALETVIEATAPIKEINENLNSKSTTEVDV